MDKIKPYLDLLKKHHFWLLAVLVVGLCTYAWYTGTAAYDDEFSSNSSKIRSAIGAADGVRNAQNPPNASFAAGLDGIKQEQVQSTLSAWQTLYDRQRNILRWTIKHDRLERLREEEEIPKDIRDEYMNYFATYDYWPKLFEVIDPLRTEESEREPERAARDRRSTTTARPGTFGTGGTSRQAGGTTRDTKINQPKQVGIVEWSQADRDAVRARYAWQNPPSSMQVRLAQEDFWIYKALLEIIANTNKSAGSTNHSNAAIKRIDTLAIAQAAGGRYRPALEALPQGAIPSEPSSGASSKALGPNATDEELMNGRYVTESGGGGTEFKLVPVMLRLRMDERRIPNLLVACANSPLPVKVEQVIYNPSGARSAAPSGGGTLGGGMMGGSSRAQARTPATSSSSARSDAEGHEATVELRGVVYIFKPPSRSALGLPEDAMLQQEDAPADMPIPGVPPVADEPVLPADDEDAAAEAPADEDGAEPADVESGEPSDMEAEGDDPPDDVPAEGDEPPVEEFDEAAAEPQR